MSIAVRGLTKEFKNKRDKNKSKLVLKDISFDVGEGEFVSLLGPSGCGKTTALTIIAGFQKHNGGQILINGKEVTKPGPDRAFVFQNYALFPWMKVGENIMYPMKKRKIPKKVRKEKLKALLEMAQLEGTENSYIHELSGGMKQRVALLRALACEPQILLMDEPLGAVDFQMRQLLQIQLETILQKKNVTTLMVTHDVDEAIYLSDRVLIMSRDHGRILGDIKVDLLRPRDRNCEQYHSYMKQLTELLKSALDGEVKNEEDEDLLDFIQKNEHKSKVVRTMLNKGKEYSAC
ncbi:MAG: ABC transporter ATP-binding protein SaoA [Zhaonellaceae bacterium]|jgi:NitT/TauT family transport system ATP-binding protein|nr:ABC transporter ATP-binding protein [Clostridia bacterium]